MFDRTGGASSNRASTLSAWNGIRIIGSARTAPPPTEPVLYLPGMVSGSSAPPARRGNGNCRRSRDRRRTVQIEHPGARRDSGTEKSRSNERQRILAFCASRAVAATFLFVRLLGALDRSNVTQTNTLRQPPHHMDWT